MDGWMDGWVDEKRFLVVSSLSASTTRAASWSVPFSLIELGARTASFRCLEISSEQWCFPATRSNGGRVDGIGSMADGLASSRPRLLETCWHGLRAFSCRYVCVKAHVMPNRKLWFGTQEQDSAALGRKLKSRRRAITTLASH